MLLAKGTPLLARKSPRKHARPRAAPAVAYVSWTLDAPGCNPYRKVSDTGVTAGEKEVMPEPILSAAVKEQCSHVFPISVTKLFHDRGQDSILVGGPLASSAREPVETLDVDTGTFTDERSLARFTQNDGKLFVTDLEGPHSLTVDGDVVVKNIPVELAPGQVLDFSGAQGDLVYEVYRDVIAHA